LSGQLQAAAALKEINPRYPLNRIGSGPQSRSGSWQEGQNILLLPQTLHILVFLCPPVGSLVSTLNKL